jgi:enolase
MGGNVSYVLEGVFLKAAAADNNMELWEFINKDVNFGKKVKMPHAVGNCIGGGLHSSDAWGKKPDFQEFLLIPRAKSFSHGVSLNIRAYRYAKKLLKSRKVNDENALRTGKTNEETLEILKRVGKKYKVRIGLDVAASSFYKGGYYFYRNKELTRDKTDQVDYIERLIRKFNIFYVEDGMQEEDFSGFKSLVGSVDGKKLIVGDDLTTTNMKLVRRAIESKAVNAVVIKPNQIGSMIEVRRVVMFCKKHGVKTVFSHRSGETMDDILADYSVGFGGDFIKTGIMGRERLIKLKRVMEIEKTLFSK